jgi:hypothetical protein
VADHVGVQAKGTLQPHPVARRAALDVLVALRARRPVRAALDRTAFR